VAARTRPGDAKAELLDYPRGARETLPWKLGGSAEYDVRRPLGRRGQGVSVMTMIGLGRVVGAVVYGLFRRPLGGGGTVQVGSGSA
jgi:hypothetical protein